jgi:choline/glycine/proline betaine transport protein
VAVNQEHEDKADSAEPEIAAKPNRINRVVFIGSSALILAFSLWAMITPEGAADTIGTVVGWISHGFGWYYFLAATLFLVFVVFIAASRYGKIKLGPQHSTPDYSIFAWGAMLFAAGIGIDLMFFSVAGPVSHYLSPPEGSPETIEAARQGIVWTLFHYGISGWAMYALMGMALGYFAFRHRLPLSIRSLLYPVFGKRIHGRIGDTVDLAAVLGTIFGIAVSLGIGVVQLNFGLNFMFDVPVGTAAQVALIAVAVAMATVSAVAGIDKGIRRLSELNIVLAITLMLYVAIQEDPIELLNGLVLNIGDYMSRFPGMTMNTFAYDPPVDWLNDWTLFFWAWWIAWAPFVGLFLARISRGRTIRQFVAATLVVPFLFTLSFLSVFGNSALSIVRNGNAEFGETAANAPEQGFYTLLDQYPGVTFSAGLATFVGLLFYVTSADSGALVMGNFTSRLATPTTDAARWVRNTGPGSPWPTRFPSTATTAASSRDELVTQTSSAPSTSSSVSARSSIGMPSSAHRRNARMRVTPGRTSVPSGGVDAVPPFTTNALLTDASVRRPPRCRITSSAPDACAC